MTAAPLSTLYRTTRDTLTTAGIVDAGLEARWLIAHLTGLSEVDVLTSDAPADIPALDAAIARRVAGEPLSKIIGVRAFYGLSFETNRDVLDPRPDSETLVSGILDWAKTNRVQNLLELGVGSGCLILSALHNLPDARGMGVDISDAALATAARNAHTLCLHDRITFLKSNWTDALPADARFDVILSNPPYIETAVIADLDIGVRDHDPHLALDGGADGLDAYRIILDRVRAHMAPDGALFLEVGKDQEDQVAEIGENLGWHLYAAYADLGGIVRVLRFQPNTAMVTPTMA